MLYDNVEEMWKVVRETKPRSVADVRYQTQWAAQFFVLGELTLRGYTAALTHGNARDKDILVSSRYGHPFSINVKGSSKRKAPWLIKYEAPIPEHYFILVSLESSAPRYYILSSTEMLEELASYNKEIFARRGVLPKVPGFDWDRAFKYENKWDTLPLVVN